MMSCACVWGGGSCWLTSGGNSNGVSRIQHRKPMSRIVKFLIRLLSRLGTVRSFKVFVCFISPPNNKLCDELPRAIMTNPEIEIQAFGMAYSEVLSTFKRFLAESLGDLSLILLTDLPGRVRVVMQFVQKRTVLTIPTDVNANPQFIFLGIGCSWRWKPRSFMGDKGMSTLSIPWHSESPTACQECTKNSLEMGEVFVFRPPPPVLKSDHDLRKKVLVQFQPEIIVFDCHPNWDRNSPRSP